MTAHSKRRKRGRTEIDIATQYFEEEKEKTKAIMEKKKRQFPSDSPEIPSSTTNSSIESKIEEKNKKHPITKKKRSSPSKKSPYSHKKGKIKRQKRRTVVKKSRERKKRPKRVRTQYFQRYIQ